MKVGSLVVHIENSSVHNHPYVSRAPQKDEILTIRRIDRCPSTGIECALFEEFSIGFTSSGEELACMLSYLRELLPPEEIAEALEEVNEVLKEQEVLV